MWAAWGRQPSGALRSGDGAFVPEIESLRGIAITLVFLLHLSKSLNFLWPQVAGISPLAAFVLGGHTGVSSFFVLSGFLLGRPFLLEVMHGKRMDRSAYYARRALRILPGYFVAVAVGSALTAQRPLDVLRGVPYLFFLQAFTGTVAPLRPYSDVWWSLATEVHFYLLLPVLPFFLRSRSGRRLGALVALAYIVAYHAFLTGQLHAATFEGRLKLAHSLFGRAPQFAVGVLVAWICERFGPRMLAWNSERWWVRSGGGDLAVVLLLWCLGALLRRVVLATFWDAELRWPAWHLVEGAIWGTVLLLLLLVPLWTRVLFCNRVWNALGRISYSIYLIHGALITCALGAMNRIRPGVFGGANLRTLSVATIVTGLCLALSSLTYLTIERPFLRRKGRLAWWSPARPVAPAAAVDPTIVPSQPG